jgi:hypothetical protein
LLCIAITPQQQQQIAMAQQMAAQYGGGESHTITPYDPIYDTRLLCLSTAMTPQQQQQIAMAQQMAAQYGGGALACLDVALAVVLQYLTNFPISLVVPQV